MSLSYEEFLEEFEGEYMICTHEFSFNRKELILGRYKDKNVVLKKGRFLKEEIEIYKKIKHTNIVEYIMEIYIEKDTDDGDDISYILMERVMGDSLH